MSIFKIEPCPGCPTRYVIRNTELGCLVRHQKRDPGKNYTSWGNHTAVYVTCNRLNREFETGKPIQADPYRNPHYGF